MAIAHWSWNYFYTDGELFGRNQSNKNAWCLGCLNHHTELLRQSDLANGLVTGMGGGRTDEERDKLGTLLLAS